MMDRPGKERLIGAGILVALAVAVVPELLSGPKPMAPVAESPRLPVGAPDPVRNVTMDLTTSKPTDPASAAPVGTAPVGTAPVSTAPVSTAPTSTLPAPALPPADPAAPAPGVPTTIAPSNDVRAPGIVAVPQLRPDTRPAGALAVQLGSFANRSNAETLVHQLKALGYAVYESTEGTGKNARYRVRVGPFSDRDSAERTIVKLKASGHASTLIGAH